jgi:type III secretion system FlhB-like substrate exporter
MTVSSVEEIVGNIRQFDVMLKAEQTLDSIIKTLDVDCCKPESMENLLGVLSHIIQGKFF